MSNLRELKREFNRAVQSGDPERMQLAYSRLSEFAPDDELQPLRARMAEAIERSNSRAIYEALQSEDPIKALLCQSCGSSMVIPGQILPLAACPACGAMNEGA